MKLLQVIGAAVVISLAGSAVPAHAQRGEQGEKHGGHEKWAEHEKPGKGEKHPGREAHGDWQRGPEQHRPQRVEHGQPPRAVETRREHVVVRHVPEGQRRVDAHYEHRAVWQDRRAREWAHEHRTWVQRGGYHGYRVPHDRYIVYFGPRHHFRIHTLPVVVVAGHPRFHYNGYWVTMVDPWPEYWATNWYETDDVYVRYVNDGYYLYNVAHPGVAIAVNISF